MRISDWNSDVCPSDLFQIFRIGNLAVLGVPFEVTTMSGRRLRKTVLDALSPVGVDTVIIAGLSNDYLHYMATREEYSAQMYEGSSRSEEHTSELQSLMRISYAVLCLKKKKNTQQNEYKVYTP